MMLKNFQLYIIDKKDRIENFENFVKYLEYTIRTQHSGKYRKMIIECHFNPDDIIIYNKPSIIMDMDDIILPFAANESKGKITKIKQSILKNGLRVPLSVDKNNKLLDGHHRYMALKELGYKKVKVVKYEESM